MTLASRLRTSAAAIGRSVAGAALGLGLVVALAGSPAAWAQDAASPAAVPQAPAGSGPALWVIKDADSTIYLFGTVHVLRPTTAWGSPTVDAAFDSADTIWFEITNPDDQAAALPLIQRYGLSPDRPLSSLLTAEELAKLDEAAASIGGSAAAFDPMRPWLVALSLSISPLLKAGYDPNSGVELVLRARAQAAGKPVKGLETLEEQIGILAGFPEEAQLTFLRQTLESYDEATTQLDGLVAAWAAGDVAGIERLGVDEMAAEPVIYDAMLTRRNANWAGQIETMLQGSGTAFIAVGSAHLAGDDSVQVFLGRRGVTVERVQ
ncbi:MAG: TraB/GumN family protein [Alphaproteobacteria bacterium]|nr:TraB/GumN family protein [Alphaproteobacteria bacterium]MBU1527147.1 TraB/GumN family protein [Alphaproteobacteria bacterium]MBU2383274.1 TraB/GumN family protein [Alphaproteobacteria bacterium]